MARKRIFFENSSSRPLGGPAGPTAARRRRGVPHEQNLNFLKFDESKVRVAATTSEIAPTSSGWMRKRCRNPAKLARKAPDECEICAGTLRNLQGKPLMNANYNTTESMKSHTIL